jgi:hypothetical protein
MSDDKKAGIATDVLLYLDGRFDSITKVQDNVNKELFDKLNEITVIVKENLVVAKIQNSRIYKLEKKHESCPGVEAISRLNIKKAVDDKADEIKSEKGYVIGKVIKEWSITAVALTGIVAGVMLIVKYFVG